MARSAEARRIRLSLTMIRAVESLYAKLPEVSCKGLCQDACGPVFMTPFEMDRIVARIGHRPVPSSEVCPLLGKDGRCSEYDLRPAVCRIYGATPGLTCPHGCGPEKPLEPKAAMEWYGDILKATGSSPFGMDAFHSPEAIQTAIGQCVADAEQVKS